MYPNGLILIMNVYKNVMYVYKNVYDNEMNVYDGMLCAGNFRDHNNGS